MTDCLISLILGGIIPFNKERFCQNILKTGLGFKHQFILGGIIEGD